MTEAPEDRLRDLVRTALADARISQAEASRQLGVSTKHLNQMLLGHVRMSLTWAEGLLGLCGWDLVITTRPDTSEEQPVICQTCVEAASRQAPREEHCDAEPGAPNAACFCQHRTDRYRTQEQK